MLPLASLHITLQISLRTVLWHHLGDIWPLGGDTKEKWLANIGTWTRDPRFACPNASHCTTYCLLQPCRLAGLLLFPFIFVYSFVKKCMAPPVTLLFNFNTDLLCNKPCYIVDVQSKLWIFECCIPLLLLYSRLVD